MNYERQEEETCTMVKTSNELIFSFTDPIMDASCDAFKRHHFVFDSSRGAWIRTIQRKAFKSAKAR